MRDNSGDGSGAARVLDGDEAEHIDRNLNPEDYLDQALDSAVAEEEEDDELEEEDVVRQADEANWS